MTSDDTAQASAHLTIEVYTAPARPFVSATPPQAPDDEPTWSPMSATLIYGEHDAILVDTLATYDHISGISPGSPPKRRQRPASSPGWSNAIPTGRTCARCGTPRAQPLSGRADR